VWGAQLLHAFEPIAARLDALHGGSGYRDALASANATLGDASLAPSARALAVMARDFDSSYVGFTRAQSDQTRNHLLATPFTAEQQARFAALAKASVDEQKRIEAADSLPFEQYRLKYLSVERLGVPESRTVTSH
jgi:glutamate--cysteine ligase